METITTKSATAVVLLAMHLTGQLVNCCDLRIFPLQNLLATTSAMAFLADAHRSEGEVFLAWESNGQAFTMGLSLENDWC